MGKPTVLVVDDDRSHRLMLKTVLVEDGYGVLEAQMAEEALEIMGKKGVDLVLMDLKMPGMGGLGGLNAIQERRSGVPVIMMTAFATVSTAVEALKNGAQDYLTKPLDIEEVKMTLRRVLEQRRLEEENRALKERLSANLRYPSIIGEGETMKKVFQVMSMVAPTDSTVLITGESGTGKELVAEAIHRESKRSGRPFIRVNCAALPESLLESELFGHEKGAFTGAHSRRDGRFQLADGGTLFLDEIAEMSPSVQAKLLRVLENSTFEPVGSSRTITVDIRIIAATNRSLKQEIEAGRFREDLYYRLAVVPIRLPLLRERKEDIPILAGHFLEVYRHKVGRNVSGFTPKAMQALLAHSWPGNVRELENAVERAVVVCTESLVNLGCLPEEIARPAPAIPREADRRGRTLEDVEREIIIRTLEESGGNRSEAARRLGITRQTLLKRIGRGKKLRL